MMLQIIQRAFLTRQMVAKIWTVMTRKTPQHLIMTMEKKFLVKKASKATHKIIRTLNNPSKEISTIAASGSQELISRKPKPTNPKPFRLRTDERVIYKDANLEKKPHLRPLKEIKSLSTIPQRHRTLIQSNNKCLVESQDGNETSEINGFHQPASLSL